MSSPLERQLISKQTLERVTSCTACDILPLGPRPILQLHPNARILIAGHAPGRKTHEKGIPFDDASGNRLRDWMGLSRDQFYDIELVAVLPMALCYPGTSTSGDLPPPPICAEKWRSGLLKLLPRIDLTLLIGQYALDWHLKEKQPKTLTETVRNWKSYWPEILPMPHPSPRNNRWLKKNLWFEDEVLPELRRKVATFT